MLESQVLAVITFSLEELLAWPCPLRGAEFSLSLCSSPFVIYTQSVSQPGERKTWPQKNRFQKKCTTRSYLCLLWEVDGVWPGPLPLPPVAPAPHLLLPAGLLLRPRLKGGRINGGTVVFTRILAL